MVLHEQNRLLREADKHENELISVVSHDLRTPLTSIMGYLELVLDEADGQLTAEQRSFLEIVMRNANRLLALVNDLLFISQAEAGKAELDLDTVDVAELAADAVEALQPSAVKVEVDLRLVAESAVASVDRARIAELIENLSLECAQVHAGQRRRRGSSGPGKGVGVLKISDKGLGITAADQRHLFERFFRGAQTSDTTAPHAGLRQSNTRLYVHVLTKACPRLYSR